MLQLNFSGLSDLLISPFVWYLYLSRSFHFIYIKKENAEKLMKWKISSSISFYHMDLFSTHNWIVSSLLQWKNAVESKWKSENWQSFSQTHAFYHFFSDWFLSAILLTAHAHICWPLYRSMCLFFFFFISHLSFRLIANCRIRFSKGKIY